ncbi:MAG: hypothetical protein ACK4Q5_05950 [Saprospiraceae bacterium]
MIQLFVNDETLDLRPDTSIGLELVSPAFVEDSGSYSYPFDLPRTQKNLRLLGDPARLDRREKPKTSIAARLFVGGSQVCEGALRFSFPAAGQTIKVFLVVNGFADAIADKTIRDINHQAPQNFVTLSALQTHMADTVNSPASHEHVFFPVYAGEKYNLQNPFTGGVFYPEFFESKAAPFPYLYFIVKRIFDTFGWAWDDRFFSISQELRTLVLVTPREIERNSSSAFPLDLKNIVPKVGIGAFLKAIAGMFGLGLFFTSSRRRATLLPLKTLVTQSDYTDWSRKADEKFEVTIDQPDGFTLGFDWDSKDELHNDYLRKNFRLAVRASGYYLWSFENVVEAFDNLAGLSGMANLTTYWVNKEQCFYWWQAGSSSWIRLNYIYKGVLANSAAVTSPSEGDLYYFTDQEQYQIRIRTSGGGLNWRPFAHRRADDYVVGRGVKSIRSVAHPVNFYYLWLGNVYTYPAYFITDASTVDSAQAEQDTAIRLLFYRGYNTSTIGPVPFGSLDVKNMVAGAVIANYSLFWDGQYGLYEKWWKEWLDFLSKTKKVERKIRLSAGDLAALDMTKKYRIHNVDYLLGRVSVNITMRGIQPATVELYTIQ